MLNWGIFITVESPTLAGTLVLHLVNLTICKCSTINVLNDVYNKVNLTIYLNSDVLFFKAKSLISFINTLLFKFKKKNILILFRMNYILRERKYKYL